MEKKIYGNKYYSCWPLARLLADAFTDLPDDTVSADRRRVIRGLVYRHRPLLVSPYLVVWRRSLVAGITWWLTIYLCCAQRNISDATERAKIALFLLRWECNNASPHLLNRGSLVDRVRALSRRSMAPPSLSFRSRAWVLPPQAPLCACREGSNFTFSYPCVPLFLL